MVRSTKVVVHVVVVPPEVAVGRERDVVAVGDRVVQSGTQQRATQRCCQARAGQ